MKAKPEADSGFAKAAPRKRGKPGRFRRLRWVLAILGLLTGAFLFFQYRIVDTELRPIIEKQLAQAVHSPVSIGSVRAGLTGNVVLNHVSLTVPGTPWESRLVVDQISVSVDLISLLFHRKPLENCFESLSFLRPDIVLVKNETSPAAGNPSGPTTAVVPAMTVPIPIFPVPKITVREGAFSIQAEKTPREVLRGLNLTALTDNGTIWGLSVLAHSPEVGSQGIVQFDGSLRLEDLRVRGVTKLHQWPLASTGSTLKDTTGWELSSGTIDMESPVVLQPGRPIWFDAKADLSQAVLKSPDPVGITFSQITGRALIRPNEVSVPNGIKFQIGETPWRASGFIPFDGRALSVQTSTDNLVLASVFEDILKLKDMKADGKGSAAFSVAGTFSNPVIDGTAQLGPSNVGSWQLDSLSVKAGYENGQFELKQAEGKLYEGSLTADGFLALSGQPDAPVSLNINLKGVEAEKVASTLGISGYQGRIDQEFLFDGPLSNPVISSSGQMELARTLRNSIFHYSIHNSIQMKDQKLQVSATINDKSRLDCLFVERPENWELKKFSVQAGKKAVKLIGTGVWPKSDDKPIQIEVSGKDISLEDIPFFNDQFQDITGQVNVDVKVGGTKKDPVATAHLSSEEVSLKDLEPEPMEVSLTWNPNELIFDKLEVGDIFSTSGQLGLSPEAPLDLKITAQGIPIQIIAEIAGWNNPPQPFEGSMTGRLHLSGLTKNPILEGDDISVDDLKVGDWHADKVTASLALDEQGKLHFKKIKLDQGSGSLSANGTWDTKAQPGVLALRLGTNEFQLGRGPYLSGDFLLEAKTTGDPFWKNWNGDFSAGSFDLRDFKNKTYHFSNFSMAAVFESMVLKGKLKLGKAIDGSAVLDASGTTTTVQAVLKIEPSMLSEVPELTQFLPPSLKVAGNISGDIKLKQGTFEELPMEGSVFVTDGKIQKYSFDRMGFKFNGGKTKVSSSFTLARGEASYNLSGTLEAPRAIWDPDSKINVNGPVEREKLQNILALLGIDTEKHKVGGEVNGNLSIAGLLTSPVVGFSIVGQNLRYDNNIVPAAELHFSAANGKITLEKNRLTLQKGQVNIDNGSAYFDPEDSTVVVLDLRGSTQDLPIAVFDLTSQIHLSGRLALEAKENRPTFDGLLSIIESGQDPKNIIPFDLALGVHNKIVDFKPLDGTKAQLVGQLDLSQDQKIIFKDLHLLNTSGSFSVDGTLDFNGPCQLVSDAKDVPIQEVWKWLFPKFPLSGIGNYHLLLNGTLDDPLFTTSLSVSNGKIGDLNFDLLDGELKSHDNTMYFGGAETPLMLSRKGLFTFTVGGKMPFALTKASWLKVQNREMDITANMDQGDFGIILLAGFAKQASGNMDFSAHVGGTLDNPNVISMDLDLNKCRLVPEIVAQSIEDISGRIKIRNNHLGVEDLNGRIGQGRVFITSDPVDKSKMVLENFIPQYLDFHVRTVGDHGLWLSIPTIMKKGEWGEIYFYGASPTDDMLIQGPLDEPHVIGTAFLDTGHFTFPPEEALDEHGQKIEYRELAGVYFQLKLKSGKNTWYSNEFSTQYLELKVDPGDEIYIEGKDADRTPEEPGIKCVGDAGSKQGWLRYLGHEFQLEEATLHIPKGKPPFMQGRATDRLRGIEVPSAGGVQKTDMDIWVDFSGTFGKIDFNLDSNPRFSMTDKDIQQKLLLSYIMFGRDMTGYTSQQLQQVFQQNNGQVVSNSILETFDRISSSQATQLLRPLGQKLGGIDMTVDANLGSALYGSNQNNSSVTTSAGVSQVVPVGQANNAAGSTVPLVQVRISKPLDRNLSILAVPGVNRDSLTGAPGFQGQFGLQYDFSPKLDLNAITGTNDIGEQETKVVFELHQALPDPMTPKKGDTVKPHFERTDAYSIGAGKYQLNWETDKVTKSEIRIMDENGQMVQDVLENGQHAYDHQMVIDKLNPTESYKVEILVKDLNENENETILKISASDSDD